MRKHGLLTAVLLGASLAGVTLASACSSTTLPSKQNLVAVSEASGRCEAMAIDAGLKPIASLGQGSSVALGQFSSGPYAGKTIAFVADEDAKAIIAVDVDAKKQIASHALGTAPSQILLLEDGRLAVTLRGASKVQIFHPSNDGSFVDGCAVDTDAEPIALAETPDKKTLLVTTGWSHALDAFDTTSLKNTGKVDLPREPRGVVVDDAGKTAYVVHAVGGEISTVDLASLRTRSSRVLVNPNEGTEIDQPVTLSSAVTRSLGSVENQTPGRAGLRVGCQGFPVTKSTAPAGRILAPQVLVDPGDPDNRPAGYGDGASQSTELTNVAVIDAGTQRILDTSLAEMGNRAQMFGEDGTAPLKGECILPRAATVDPTSNSLLVSCFGIDAIVAYDASSATPGSVEKMRWDVGSGPTGIAVDTAQNRAIVWSQFDRTLSVIDLRTINAADGDPPRPERITLDELDHPMPLNIMLGRQIFNTVGDQRISKDGRACASCHPDGRDDSITWATPDGPRRSVMLAGRLHGTEPFAWAGTSKDLHDHLHHTFDRLNGQGLRSVDLEALASYVEALPAPPREGIAQPDKVARGKEIFNSKEAQCSTCHADGGEDGKTHDVKSRHHADKKPEFDTPTLKYVSGHAPYFHDGRYATLHDLIVQSDGTMGHTAQLSTDDVDALEAFLRSL